MAVNPLIKQRTGHLLGGAGAIKKGQPPNLRSASTMQLIGYYCFGNGAEKAAAREAPA